MLTSIRWKIVLIYLLLILLASEVLGVYLLRSLEDYFIQGFIKTIEPQVRLVSRFLERYMGEDGVTGEAIGQLDDFLAQFSQQTRVQAALYRQGGVLLAASNTELPQTIEVRILNVALTGRLSQSVLLSKGSGISSLHVAIPIVVGGRVAGAVYAVAPLTETYRTLNDVRLILLTAMSIALAITVLLGLALARTITKPVEEITAGAREMAKGNFDQVIPIRTNDEIGQLGKMFNFLATRLKQTLSEISSEKNKLEAILTFMTDGVLALDKDCKIVALNPAASRMLGINGDQPNEVSDSSISYLLDDADIAHSLRTGCECYKKISVSGKVLGVSLAPLKSGHGGAEGTVVVLQDITERERLDQLRTEFVANVSHELRTPLTTIKSYVETLLDGALQDPGVSARFLGTVNKEADRMTRLIKDLLDLSRFDHGQAKLNLSDTSIVDLVKDVVGRLEMTAEQKRVTVSVNAMPPIPSVEMDAEKIDQVMTNLVSNAIEYTPCGGNVWITIKKEDQNVVVAVGDNGMGIPPEDLPRIFERFYRVDKARSREKGGTGLGLSICKEIINSHGGDISIESDLGVGTVVTVLIPTKARKGGGYGDNKNNCTNNAAHV